jgi:hypothetical protein
MVVGAAGGNVVVYEAYGDEMVRIEPDGEFVAIEFPEQLDELYSDPWRSSPTAWVTGPSTGDEWWERDLWLIATPDGVEWFTLDIPDVTEDVSKQWNGGFTGPYTNGRMILYQTVEGWWMVEMETSSNTEEEA